MHWVNPPSWGSPQVRNRWHRLEKAERQRREALEAGRPVEGYRCRKCGHFKKGHMCLGLEEAAPADGNNPPPPRYTLTIVLTSIFTTNPPPQKKIARDE